MGLSQFSEGLLQLVKAYPFPNLNYLCNHFPTFCVCSSQVRILYEPTDFYNELITQCERAKERIILASLYLGTGELEKNLVSIIQKQLTAKPDLRTLWLLDYTRASRNTINSRTLLLPILEDTPDRCTVSLYHTPSLRGLLKYLLPERWNEIVGLQHMKIYIFDSSLLISGANLSNDYFLYRQDRYIVIDNCKELTDFYEELVGIVASFSLQLTPQNEVKMRNAEEGLHPCKGSYSRYCDAVKESIEEFWQREIAKSKYRLINVLQSRRSFNTLIFPTLQMPPFGINYDDTITKRVISRAPQESTIHLASGYFNLTRKLMDCILRDSNAAFKIICAHPKANGFLNANGLAGGIPAAYTNLCKLFYLRVLNFGLTDRISISEYIKDSWTFHAKGLWYFLKSQGSLPICTMVGSPNFGYRSVYRDLETQLIVITSCSTLRKTMFEEQERLFQSSFTVSEDTFMTAERVVPLWVKAFTFFLKHYF